MMIELAPAIIMVVTSALDQGAGPTSLVRIKRIEPGGTKAKHHFSLKGLRRF
jgi:hypothetical protein